MKSFFKQYSLFTWAFVAVLLVAAAFSLFGQPLVSPEIMASAVAVPMLAGEISMTEVKALLDKQGSAFEEFKKANDAKIAAIEGKNYAPADVVEKVEKINGELTTLGKQIREGMAELEEVQKKANRPGKTGDTTAAQSEYKAALAQYLRTGDKAAMEKAEAKAREAKAMSAQSDPDGGFVTSAEMDTTIDRIAKAEVVFAGLATERTIGKASYKKLVKTRGVAGGREGETEEGGERTAPQYSEIEIFPIRYHAEPWVPNDLLDDADYDLEADLSEEAGITFAELEGYDFIQGSGVKCARGILSYPTVANASWAWGKVGFINTGVSADFAATNKADKIVALQHSLKQRYRPGASFLTNDQTLAAMRQFKDGSGSYYLWNPDPSKGPSGTFLGSVVNVDDYMPDMAANSFSLAYGDWKRAYTIVRRRGIALIRDNVTKKGTTKFNFTRRTGGGVTNFEAFKLLKFI